MASTSGTQTKIPSYEEDTEDESPPVVASTSRMTDLVLLGKDLPPAYTPPKDKRRLETIRKSN